MKRSSVVFTSLAFVTILPHHIHSQPQSPSSPKRVRGNAANEVATAIPEDGDRDLYEVETITMDQCCTTVPPMVDTIIYNETTLPPTDPPSSAPTTKIPTLDPTLSPTFKPTNPPTNPPSNPDDDAYLKYDDPTGSPTFPPSEEPTQRPTSVGELPTPPLNDDDTDDTPYRPKEDDDHGYDNDDRGHVTRPLPPCYSSSKSGKSSKSAKSSKSSKSGKSRRLEGCEELYFEEKSYEGADSSSLNRVSGLVAFSEVTSGSDRGLSFMKYTLAVSVAFAIAIASFGFLL